MITESHLKHFYRTPRIPRDLLVSKREGLLIGSACEAGELYRAVLSGKPREELLRIASFYDYLEIQPLDNNAFLVESGAVRDRGTRARDKQYPLRTWEIRSGVPCVMTCEFHYLDPDEAIYRTVLLAGKGWRTAKSPRGLSAKYGGLHRRSIFIPGQAVLTEVVVANTRAIADSVENLLPVPRWILFPVASRRRRES